MARKEKIGIIQKRCPECKKDMSFVGVEPGEYWCEACGTIFWSYKSYKAMRDIFTDGKNSKLKLRIDSTWQGKKRTERLEIRTSKNFMLIVNALIDKFAKEHRGYSKADLLHKAIIEMAEKEKLLLVGDIHWI